MNSSSAIIGWTLLGVGAILLYEGAYKGNTGNPFSVLLSTFQKNKAAPVATGYNATGAAHESAAQAANG